MATVYFLYRSVKDKANLTVRLQDDIDGQKFQYSSKTEIEVAKKYWFSTRHKLRNVDAQDKKLISEINSKTSALEQFILLRYKNDQPDPKNKNWLGYTVNQFYEPEGKGRKLSQKVNFWIDEIIRTAPSRENSKGGLGLSKSRVNSYKNLKKIFSRHPKSDFLKVKDLNKAWFEDFRSWLLLDNGYAATYTNKKISDLKMICKFARAKVPAAVDLDEVSGKKVSAYDSDMDVVFLTIDELDRIEETELPNDKLKNARKWLILSCYTGQRGQDLINRIIEQNFVERADDLVIKYVQEKGNKAVTIPVLPKVRTIYDTGLPYKVSTQKLNKYFKDVCQLAGIDDMVMGRIRDKKTNRGIKKLRPKYKYIGTHSGRRSFASNHYGKLPTPIIMAVTGHQKESSFLTYINSDREDHIDIFLDYYRTLDKKAKKESNLKIVKKASND